MTAAPLDDVGPDPLPRLNRHSDRARSAVASIKAEHSATQAALLAFVSESLAAKVAHDVDRFPLALEALDAFTATAGRLRAEILTEQQHTAEHQQEQERREQQRHGKVRPQRSKPS